MKNIDKDNRQEAINLIQKVFMEFEAPDYCEQGVETFKNTALYNNEYLDNLVMYGAYDKDVLLGVIATRNNGSHVALFFVDGRFHNQKIGTKLFQNVVQNSPSNKITVNSSPYAVEVYHHLGFVDTDVEKVECGMRYTPMVYTKAND